MPHRRLSEQPTGEYPVGFKYTHTRDPLGEKLKAGKNERLIAVTRKLAEIVRGTHFDLATLCDALEGDVIGQVQFLLDVTRGGVLKTFDPASKDEAIRAEDFSDFVDPKVGKGPVKRAMTAIELGKKNLFLYDALAKIMSSVNRAEAMTAFERQRDGREGGSGRLELLDPRRS